MNVQFCNHCGSPQASAAPPPAYAPNAVPQQSSNPVVWIVLIIVGLFFFLSLIPVAFIVVPRISAAGRKAKESTLRANLHQIRNATEQFQADTGLYPASLTDLVRTKASPPSNGVNEAGGTETIPAGSFQGPYLSVSGGIGVTGIPVNPYTSTSNAKYTDVTAHWSYNVEGPGVLHPAVPLEGTTLDGVPYTAL